MTNESTTEARYCRARAARHHYGDSQPSHVREWVERGGADPGGPVSITAKMVAEEREAARAAERERAAGVCLRVAEELRYERVHAGREREEWAARECARRVREP